MSGQQTKPVAVAVVRHQGRFLVGIRPTGIALAGYSEFPGGKLLPGESPQQAAVRECQEETGLAVTVVGQFSTQLHDYAHGRLEIHFIDCRPDNAQAEPRPPFVWIDAAELAERTFPEANAALLAQLLHEAGQGRTA